MGIELAARYFGDGYSNSSSNSSAGYYCYFCDIVTNNVIGKATISTSYIQPNCSFATLQDTSSFSGSVPYIKTVLNMTNATTPTIQIAELWSGQPWQSLPSPINGTIISICDLSETKVEMEILCSAQGCKSIKERATTGQPLSSSLFKNVTAVAMFLNSMVLSGGIPHGNTTSDAAIIDSLISQNFDHGTGFFDAWKPDYIGPSSIKGSKNADILYAMIADRASQTLSRLLNGYLTVSQQALMNRTKEHIIDVLRGAVNDPNYVLERMKGAPFQPQYRLNWIWMTLDFVGCVVLLVAASVAVWLRTHTLAPDIFGYVSSLTRDNPMIDVPAGGSTLNGIDRARMLKGVKVKIADVGGNDGLGRVGLAMKNSRQENVAELREG